MLNVPWNGGAELKSPKALEDSKMEFHSIQILSITFSVLFVALLVHFLLSPVSHTNKEKN